MQLSRVIIGKGSVLGSTRNAGTLSKCSLIVDLSADYRFDPAWTYGLPELIDRQIISKAKRISNPGCYAVSLP